MEGFEVYVLFNLILYSHTTFYIVLWMPYVRVSPDTSSFWAPVRASGWFFKNPQFVRVFVLQPPFLTFFGVLVGPYFNYNLRPRRHNLVLSLSITDRDFITE